MSEEELIGYELKSLKINESLKIKLDKSVPSKDGQSQFGNWFMWFGEVNGITAFRGKKPKVSYIPDYSGTIFFFAGEPLTNKLINLVDGNDGVDVIITKTAREGLGGKILTEYVPTIEGETVQEEKIEKPTNLSLSEMKLVNDAKELVKSGQKITEAVFITASKEIQYGGNISEERAKELYILIC